jgi:hypothetical protein
MAAIAQQSLAAVFGLAKTLIGDPDGNCNAEGDS